MPIVVPRPCHARFETRPDFGEQGDLGFVADRIFDGDRRRSRHGNAVITTRRPFPGGREVITIGTTDWEFALGRDVAVDRVTANALERHL